MQTAMQYQTGVRGAEFVYTNCSLAGFAHGLETRDFTTFVVTLPVRSSSEWTCSTVPTYFGVSHKSDGIDGRVMVLTEW